jgi:hypothetical protein
LGDGESCEPRTGERRETTRMNSVFAKLMIAFLLVSSLGCSSIKNLTKDGIGQPISTITDRWGPPSRVSSDGKGGTVYVWEQWGPNPEGGGHIWSNTYWVDSNGIIYKWM